MLKDTRMTSFLIFHQMTAKEKAVTWERYEPWFFGIIYIFFDINKTHRRLIDESEKPGLSCEVAVVAVVADVAVVAVVADVAVVAVVAEVAEVAVVAEVADVAVVAVVDEVAGVAGVPEVAGVDPPHPCPPVHHHKYSSVET